MKFSAISILRFIGVSLLFCTVGCFYAIHHDEDLASTRAAELFKTAILCKDIENGYQMMEPKFRDAYSLDKFKELVANMHLKGFPTRITIVSYGMIPRQKAMNILARGENDKEQFHYRLIMTGTKKDNYLVGGILRGNMEYPPSKLVVPFTKPVTILPDCK